MGNIGSPIPYGRRLVPVLLDQIAEEDPKRVFASLPRTSDIKDGFFDVTFGDFARGINRMAEWLEASLGRSKMFETLAYIRPSDIRYFALVVAASKVGYKMLLPSPRNSLEGQLNLFATTQCKTILTSKNYNLQPKLLSESQLQQIEVPELKEMFAEGKVREYKLGKSFEEAKNDPFLVLHTSGSTGLPKPIVLKHGWYAAIDASNELPIYNGCGSMFNMMKGKKVFGTLPPFHGGGVCASLLMPLMINSTTVWAPTNRPPNAALIDEVLDAVDIEVLYAAPSVIEEMTQSPASLERFAKLDAVAYGGGPLSQQAGDMVSQITNVLNTIGSTEISVLPIYSHSRATWEYFHYPHFLQGIEFRDQGDGTYEQVIVRHPPTDRYHSAWWTFPELEEYSMSDLYVKHPEKEGLWKYIGRADDVIVLSNGERLNPTSMEDTLRGHRLVNGALVVGHARFAPAVIIELADGAAANLQSPEEKAGFIDEIWPFAVDANKVAPSHAQLAQDRVILSTDGKPFLRAGKGTVQRQATIKIYAEEIDELYRRSDEGRLVDIPKVDINQDISILKTKIGNLASKIMGVGELEGDKDFFTVGMDSLHVMTIIQHLKASIVGMPLDRINTRLVYTNPTVSALAAALKDLSSANSTTSGTIGVASREKVMEETLERYINQLPAKFATSQKPHNPEESLTVILTGSTGSLGSYLLDTLVSSPRISKVYCLNRRPNAAEIQGKSNFARRLVSKWGSRVEFLHADLSKHSLGLEQSVYERLRNETSVIIHNQWKVDFNLSLTSFEPHILGALNLIALSSKTPFSVSPPIFFTSSVGTVGNWISKHPNTEVLEMALDDPAMPLEQGYSESKWITERLLAEAGKKLGVSAAVLRLGQIAGPVKVGVKGVWNRQEWLPSIIASSKYLGVIPISLGGQGGVSWTPVDILSKILVELVENDCKGQNETWTKYYHLTNPKESKWEDLVPVIQNFYSLPKKLYRHTNTPTNVQIQSVSFNEWVKKLEDSGKTKDVDIEKNPALKLLEFFQELSQSDKRVRLATRETERKSTVMRGLKAVDGEWMQLWLEQWAF